MATDCLLSSTLSSIALFVAMSAGTKLTHPPSLWLSSSSILQASASSLSAKHILSPARASRPSKNGVRVIGATNLSLSLSYPSFTKPQRSWNEITQQLSRQRRSLSYTSPLKSPSNLQAIHEAHDGRTRALILGLHSFANQDCLQTRHPATSRQYPAAGVDIFGTALHEI
ncbi:hypothetical protein CPB84DRAFT_202198 [Gymnopilus junonius]|uniref:Uncharacterized protein n=1 Tax=Gymnopilus junonius TaxID=109634 RepID=A0A9P5TQV5_GYMJU|nr:hypothetical protein CPB84DRAFT_202198 [Gymnopilus junonius]